MLLTTTLTQQSVARREAVRVLVAFGGDHAQYMSDTVTHVVSERPWYLV